MPAPDPYGAYPIERFTALDYRETLASMRPSGENSFSRRDAECALEVKVPSPKLVSALRFFLGYDAAVLGPSLTRVLARTNPVEHPRYRKLYCTAASEQEFAPSGSDADILTNPGKVPGKAKRVRPSSDGGYATPGNFNPYWTNYKWARVLLRFQPLPYEVLEDDAVAGLSLNNLEYLRNTWVDTEARTEVLSLNWQYTFAEGENCPAPYTNPKGNKFPGDVGQVIVRPDVVWHWELVPADYVMKSGTNLPTKLLSVLGKVNANYFQGYERGTLLAVALKLTRHKWGLARGAERPYLYDVELLASHFDPTKGFAGDPPVQITTNRGHNNLPYSGNLTTGAPVDPNGGRWFFATLGGDPAGRPAFEYAPFEKAWDAADNP